MQFKLYVVFSLNVLAKWRLIMSKNKANKLLSKEWIENQEKERATGTFDGEAQHFSSIKKIYAKDGFVFIEVYDGAKVDKHDILGNKLKDQMMSIRDAAARAQGLNAMAHKFPKKDREVCMEIVENVIEACKEAQEQAGRIADGKSRSIITATESE